MSRKYETSMVPVMKTREEFASLKITAENGAPEMQCAVGDICADDTRAELFNVAEAAYWYEKAALQGHTRAQWLLGASYAQGIGVDRDAEKAEYWLLKSAQSGDADGQYTMAGYYFMKPDIVKAKYWIDRAVEQGHGEAKAMQDAVSHLYEI